MIGAPDLVQWLDEVGGEEWTWFAKRLSANDTGLTKSHQVGIYLPKPVAFPLLDIPYPNVRWTERENPDRRWEYWLVSHNQHGELRLIYYNQGSRNECRITGFGGQRSPLQDPENTSSLLLMAFRPRDGRLHAWLARHPADEEVIESRIGETVPGIPVYRRFVAGELRLDELIPSSDVCDVSMDELPKAWGIEFPPPVAITAEAVRRIPGDNLDPDTRLMRRYECEFRLFRTVEAAHLLPTVSGGFDSVDHFLSFATSVLNRRKSRAGRALELHMEAVLVEEKIPYKAQAMTEVGSVVDFVFPSLDRYHDAEPGDPSLHMLAVKTTLKDRWRQVVQEAHKIKPKHLFTLDEGVSLATYQDMASRGLQLVVPQRNVAKFPVAVRLDLLTLGRFLKLVRVPAKG